MRRDLRNSAIAVVVITLIFGLAYPLLFTGVAQVLFPGNANGSKIHLGGRVIGSKLIAQDFRKPVLDSKGKPKMDVKGKPVLTADPRWFQPRPSATNYTADATAFGNLGPNNTTARDATRSNVDSYLALERPYNPGLSAADIPVDAVTNSASGVDPDISKANARIQSRRIAALRHLPLNRVRSLIDQHTDGRFLGVIGEPGVNVLELNLAIAREAHAA
ncbi:MAG TPA: potassium-transporting ATPase subunit C [Solirubrobacteraceae bacterium]|nr:potassium-transporting ATPase subunit C [Solirubrobacteraceae bacterium]